MVMRALKGFAAVLAVLVMAFAVWVYASTHHPAAEEPAMIAGADDAPLAPAGRALTVMSWNIQFLAGNRDNHFFYTGGTDPWPDLARTVTVADEVAAVIMDADPDIVLLQEVDDGADRTHGRDQLAMLLDRLAGRYPVHTSAFYWKAAFVPHPAIMGRVGMKLTILSKYRLENAVRHALPAISSDDILRRQFNMKRAVLTADLPLEDGGRLHVMNAHLSAFAQGSDTMKRQVAKVMSLIQSQEDTGTPWIVGGDFNLLPSDGVYERMAADTRRDYNPADTELAPMMARFKAIPSLTAANGPDAALWFTHGPPDDPARAPDKTLDYLFYGGPLYLGDHGVLHAGTRLISDHLPVMAAFTVKTER